MTEKFRKAVNAPHKIFGRARQKVSEMTPSSKIGNVGRVGAISMLGLFQFLLWAAKYAMLDNHALRAMEKYLADMKVGKTKNGDDKKLSALLKQYPNLSAHLIYYMMFVMTVGGIKGVQEFSDKENVEPVNIEAESVIDYPVYEENTYGAFLARMQPITPFLISHLVSLEGVRMNDAGMHVVYDDANGKALRPGQKPKGVATIGFGSTVLKDGTAVSSSTPPITSAEAYELARHHLEVGETYFVMYCYEKGVDDVHIDSTQKALMLGSMIYNMGSDLIEEKNDKGYRARFAELRQLYNDYGFAVPDSKVRELFEKYPVSNPTLFGKIFLGINKDGNMGDCAGMYLKSGGKLAPGLVYRRWMEAGLYSGDIKPQDLLDIPVDGMPEFYQIMRKKYNDKKAAFFTDHGDTRRVNHKTYDAWHEWIQNPVNRHGDSMAKVKKIKNVLPENIVQMCRNGQCEIGSKMAIIRPTETMNETLAYQRPNAELGLSIEESTYVIGYDFQYSKAVAAFRNGDYDFAADVFKEMIIKYPGNALLHNDLAATYNKLGMYDAAIEQARIILHQIGDKGQYGAAQYNAGYAYEKKGNLQKALANYKLAVSNGNRRAQKDVTRVANKLKHGSTNNKQVFNKATKKLRNHAYRLEGGMTDILQNENDLV